MRYEILAESLRYPEGNAELEEIYTRTFDVQAPVTLDVGYAVFGEDYKRGHLLVKLQDLHREFGIDCGSELPDHLPNLLVLLPRLAAERPEEAAALAGKIVLPGVDKILEGLADGNVYAVRVRAVKELLETDYPESRATPKPRVLNLDLPAYRNDQERWPS